MHLNDDMLRAYLDHEIPAGLASQAREHLARCPECANRLKQKQDLARMVSAQMDLLVPGQSEKPRSSQLAFRRFQTQKKEPGIPMMKNRSLWTAITVIAVLAMLFSLTPVRAWANSFLGLFRVEKVTVISFDPTNLKENNGGFSDQRDAMMALFEENIQINEQGTIEKVESEAQAADLAGFKPRVPQVGETPGLYVKPSMQVNFLIDQPRMQAMLDALEVDVDLPPALHGEEIQLDVANAVISAYGDCSEQDPIDIDQPNCTVLSQLPSPTVEAPDGLDVPRLGEAMLQFLGFSEEEAKNLSAKIDWTSTLILPIPQGENIVYEEVAVDGVSGTWIESKDNDTYTLMWVKDGFLYILAGSNGRDSAREFISALP